MIRFALTGECACCGACCQRQHEHETFTCQHLATTLRPIGTALAATCRVYATRTDGMPITLLAPSGRTLAGVCGKDSLTEVRGILPHLDRGCSLTLEAA